MPPEDLAAWLEGLIWRFNPGASEITAVISETQRESGFCGLSCKPLRRVERCKLERFPEVR